MKVLIIGSNGQLGRQMQDKLAACNVQYDARDLPDIDITDPASIEKSISAAAYSSVINCAAYTNVDGAETDEETAYRINAQGPKNIAVVCSRHDIELFHVSTDYVFSGEGISEKGQLRPYIESDACKPDTAYGRTKLAGEQFVQDTHNKSYILRTAWLYGDGGNFIKTMLGLAKTHERLTVVNDQFGSPTSTVDLAEAIFALMGSGHYGTYHATCEGVCTWYDFAKKIFELKGIDIAVAPVSSDAYPRPAKRPKWSVLENTQLKKHGIHVFRHWEQALKQYLKQTDI